MGHYFLDTQYKHYDKGSQANATECKSEICNKENLRILRTHSVTYTYMDICAQIFDVLFWKEF